MPDSGITVEYGDNAWADITDGDIQSGRVERIAMLPFGTPRGETTVELLVRCDDGSLVHASLDYAAFDSVRRLFKQWHPIP